MKEFFKNVSLPESHIPPTKGYATTPSVGKSNQLRLSRYQCCGSDQFDTDPDPAFPFDTDPDLDPAFQFDTDPGPDCLIRIRILTVLKK
jgi:hypothetical protein